MSLAETEIPRVIEELARSPLFAGLDASDLQAVSEEVTLLGIAAGKVLFRQGDTADGLYIVLRGRLRSLAHDGRLLGEVGPGGFVGEMALLTGAPRSATVVAVRDSTLARLGRGSFGRFVASSPSAAVEIARTVAARAQSNASLQPGIEDFSTVCLLSSPGTPCADFEREFVAALAAAAPTKVVTAADLPSLRGADPAGEERSSYREEKSGGLDSSRHEAALGKAQDAEWFDTVEAAHRYVVYLAGAADPRWTSLCVRRADLILRAATPADAESISVGPTPNESSTLARTDVVLLHSDEIATGVAGRILRTEAFRRVYHVRRNNPGDVARLVRLLTGRGIGLALSGGARRGAAHVGVLRALQETGTTVDLVAGTSAGAIVGAMIALEHDWRLALENVHRLARMRAWRDLGPPMISLLSGYSFSRHLRDIFGEATLEDCALPLLPVCAAVESGDSFVPDHGPLWLALRASASLPGVFPPVPWQKRLLMDGALVENLPIGILSARCPLGRLLASDVGTPSLNTDLPEDLHSTSGWRLLGSRLLHRRRGATHPGFVDLLISAACATSTRQLRESREIVDCYITAVVEDHAQLSQRGGQDINVMFERGYHAALRQLDSSHDA